MLELKYSFLKTEIKKARKRCLYPQQLVLTAISGMGVNEQVSLKETAQEVL